jgi:PiT family inorganic phosphate transporter
MNFLIILGLGLTFIVSYTLGANDAATPCDTSVGSGVISVRKAIILFSLFATIGALTQGYMVMKTIGTGIIPKIDAFGAFIIVLSTSIWLITASAMGVELSVTQSLIGSVIGYGAAAIGLEKVKIDVLYKIFISWIASPILSIFLSYALYSLFFKLLKKKGRFEKFFKAWLISMLCFSAYSFGVNDIGNATGVYITVLGIKPEEVNPVTALPLAFLGCIGILLGGLTLGPRVIRTVGYKITRLDPMSGAIAELSNALTVYLFSFLPYIILGYGMPISTSIASVGAVAGIAFKKGFTLGGKYTLIFLALMWVLSILITAFISVALYKIFSLIF